MLKKILYTCLFVLFSFILGGSIFVFYGHNFFSNAEAKSSEFIGFNSVVTSPKGMNGGIMIPACAYSYPYPYPTPSIPPPSYPTPAIPVPPPNYQYPTPSYPTPAIPVPPPNYQYPTPSYPTPGYPTPSYGYPTPSYGYPTPYSYPTPSVPRTISGRVYNETTNTGFAGATIVTCHTGPATITNSSGNFSFSVPQGSGFCARVTPETRSGLLGPALNNRPGFESQKSYEWQVAGRNCATDPTGCTANQIAQDRATDNGYDFRYNPFLSCSGPLAVCDSAWHEIPGNGHTLSQPVGIFINATKETEFANTIGVVMRGLNNVVNRQNYCPASNHWEGVWTSLNGVSAAAPHTSLGTAWDIFVKDVDQWQNTNWLSGWTGWRNIGAGNHAWGTPTATSDASSNLWEFRRESDNTISYRCGAGSSCLLPDTRPYRTCQNNTCVSVDACGTSSCASDTECGGGSTCPVGQQNPHSTCISNTCVPIVGCGVSDCSACGGIPPVSPPGGGPCAINSFDATRSNINKGETITLSWSATVACTACVLHDDKGNTLVPPPSGSASVNRSVNVSPPINTIYTLFCNPGATPQSKSIIVRQPPKFCEILPGTTECKKK